MTIPEQDNVAYAEQRLKEAQKNLEFARLVRDQLPKDRQPYHVSTHAHLAEGRILYESVKTVEEVEALMQLLPGVPLVVGTGTYVTIGPKERLVRETRHYATFEDVANFNLEYVWVKGTPEFKAEWWTQLGSFFTHVECRFAPHVFPIYPRGKNSSILPTWEPKDAIRINRPQQFEEVYHGGTSYSSMSSLRWEWYFRPGTTLRQALAKE